MLTSIVSLAGDILVADKVHAIPQGRDQRDIRDGVEGAELVEGQLLVQVMDGQMGQRPVGSIYPAHNLMDHAAQPLHQQDPAAPQS